VFTGRPEYGLVSLFRSLPILWLLSVLRRYVGHETRWMLSTNMFTIAVSLLGVAVVSSSLFLWINNQNWFYESPRRAKVRLKLGWGGSQGLWSPPSVIMCRHDLCKHGSGNSGISNRDCIYVVVLSFMTSCINRLVRECKIFGGKFCFHVQESRRCIRYANVSQCVSI
jgi:hypothetical protein